MQLPFQQNQQNIDLKIFFIFFPLLDYILKIAKKKKEKKKNNKNAIEKFKTFVNKPKIV